ncbi:spidroin-1-like [Schistocerca americana]|uniref:spidroin-1-like n=1 Tax=Schistocerca americana TaxID=7009 RepID=UPI001F4FD6F4|nr:spidroin-1-like [Schistocerca americana]
MLTPADGSGVQAAAAVSSHVACFSRQSNLSRVGAQEGSRNGVLDGGGGGGGGSGGGDGRRSGARAAEAAGVADQGGAGGAGGGGGGGGAATHYWKAGGEPAARRAATRAAGRSRGEVGRPPACGVPFTKAVASRSPSATVTAHSTHANSSQKYWMSHQHNGLAKHDQCNDA